MRLGAIATIGRDRKADVERVRIAEDLGDEHVLVACSQFSLSPMATRVKWGSKRRLHPISGGGSTGATRKLAWRISTHLTGLSRAQQRWVGVPWWNSMVQPVSVRRQIELRFDRAP